MDSNNKPRNLPEFPAELLRHIVSYLAPVDNERYRRGSKKDLENANLAHSCLHQWATEYLFRDMCLTVVRSSIATQLERLLLDSFGKKVVKYIKTLQIKVPPAIRREHALGGSINDFQEATELRLLEYFGVERRDELNEEQLAICRDYHSAMVKPFIESIHWRGLILQAERSCDSVLSNLTHLIEASVGTCERGDYPTPTTTRHFLDSHKSHGISTMDESPSYIEDNRTNLGWASFILLHHAETRKISSLSLSMANLDHLSSMVTTNRLLNIAYLQYPITRTFLASSLTSLTLTIRGSEGTYGLRGWNGNTGTAGMVKYWRQALARMPNLQRLDVVGERWEHGSDSEFTETGDPNGCVIDWFLSDTKLNIPYMTFRRLRIHKDTMQKVLRQKGSHLKHLGFVDVGLVHFIESEGEDDGMVDLSKKGIYWLDLAEWLKTNMPDVQVTLINPVSYQRSLLPHICEEYVQKIRDMGYTVDCNGLGWVPPFIDC